MRTTLMVSAASLIALLACSSTTPSSGGGEPPGPPRVDAGPIFSRVPAGNPVRDDGLTFIASEAPSACERDEDCVILPSVSRCSQCCAESGVARGEAERLHAEVMAACSKQEFRRCGMYCGKLRPACFEGTCVALSDFEGGPFPGARTCAVGSAKGGALPAAGPGPSCGARPIQTGFEDGLDASWPVTDPNAFRIDRSEPLAGTGSLRISYRQRNAYLTIAQPDACAIRIAFTLRTRLLQNDLTIARIVAGDGWFFHVRVGNCSLDVAEELAVPGGVSMGIGFGGGGLPVPEDTPVRVVLTVDLRTKTFLTAVAPLGEPLPPPHTTALRGTTGAIKAIELGYARGIESGAVGAVWLDDLVID